MILSKEVFSFAQGSRTGVPGVAGQSDAARQVLIVVSRWTKATRAATLQFCILGGVLAAPVLSLLGWVGLILPPTTPLHQAAATLITGALIWLGLAITMAHLLHGNRSHV
jgi:hypothetical protein